MSVFAIGDRVYVDDDFKQNNYGGYGEVTAIIADHFVRVRFDEPQYDGTTAFEFATRRLSKIGTSAQTYADPTLKPTNPKDVIGSDKLPLHLWPETATLYGCLGLLDGALKYGRANWRETGVRATIYVDALKRHANAWLEGEDFDPDSGVPHLAHALACLAILVDAEAAGKLNDDRAYPGGYRALVEELTPHVKRLKEKHADKAPRHWTIADA